MAGKKQTASTSSTGTAASTGRKPWKKKTPIDVVMEQTDKLRQQIAEKEEEVKEMRKQLQKFEEARKIFET